MGWMADTQPVRNQLRDYNMAEESNEPKGTLNVDIELSVPDNRSDYSRLNHAMVPSRINVLSIECTQAVAQKLVERIRDANPSNSFPATWLGRTEV